MGERRKNIRTEAKETWGDFPRLDLHGLMPDEIDNQIDQFLVRARNDNKNSVEVVYGIGKGVLARAALHFLRSHPMVESIEEKAGGCIVRI